MSVIGDNNESKPSGLLDEKCSFNNDCFCGSVRDFDPSLMDDAASDGRHDFLLLMVLLKF